jgi:hypothetical protein
MKAITSFYNNACVFASQRIFEGEEYTVVKEGNKYRVKAITGKTFILVSGAVVREFFGRRVYEQRR